MFNSKYKKGMADAAKAYADFGKKQEEAIKWTREELQKQGIEISGKLDDIKGNIDHLYDYIESRDKEKLYTVYTPFDIQDMGEEEQRFLVGVLFTMSTNKKPNEYQQNYFRSIMRYLGINEPPAGTNPLAIEYIDDLKAQKAILQAVMEFLRLQDGDYYDETEQQQEFLDAFNVNSKGRQEIAYHVELLYQATGAKGLAEKYGYAEEKKDSTPDKKTTSTNITKGLSEDIAKKAYKFITGDSQETSNSLNRKVDAYVETDNFILANTIDIEFSFPFKEEDKIVSFDKNSGGISTLSDSSLLGKGWSTSLSFSDYTIIETSDKDIYCVDVSKNTTRRIYHTDNLKTLKSISSDAILIEDKGGKVLVDWNGNVIAGKYDFENICDFIYPYKNAFWSIETDWNGETHDLALYKLDYKEGRKEHIYTSSFNRNIDWIESACIDDGIMYIFAQTDWLDDFDRYYKAAIFSINLENPTVFNIEKDDIILYKPSIYSYCVSNPQPITSGWIYLGEEVDSFSKFGFRIGENKYSVYYFSFESKKTTILANGCGGDDHSKPQPNEILTIGNYVFFGLGRPVENSPKAMVSIYEPLKVQLLD